MEGTIRQADIRLHTEHESVKPFADKIGLKLE